MSFPAAARLLTRAGIGVALALTLACSKAEDKARDNGGAGGETSGTSAGAGKAAGGAPSGGRGGAPAAAGQGGAQPSGGKAGSSNPAGGENQAQGGGGDRASGGAGQGTQGGGTAGRDQAGTGGSGGSVGGGAPTTPAVHYVGRVDTSNMAAVRFAWSGTGAVVRFNGTSLSVDLGGGQEYTVVIDGAVQPKLKATDGANKLAEGLAAGEHTVELYRRTEAAQGESEIRGWAFGSGALLAPPAVTRRLEFIGDSITCGYGNEGADMSCPFTPETENHYLSYAALTARSLNAELSTVAWSGKGVVCNYGDDASSCDNPLPVYYDRILPNQAGSSWDFSRFQPDAVVVNLGTNDFSTSSDPDQATFEAAYRALLEHLRAKYPNAHILCTNGPMLSGTDLSTVRTYVQNVATALGDAKISTFQLEPQDGSDGYGCDWHPSLARHQKVATVVTAAIKSALGW